MQTDLITLTCLDATGGQTCTTPAIFSGGEMFIGLELLVLILFSIIVMISVAIFSIKVNKKYIGKFFEEKEGSEIYDI
jgi:hypothetical protein